MHDTSSNRIAVIMAGGSGERFWPLSRRDHPKQLLRLSEPDRSLLQVAVDRIAPLIPRERIFIATARHLVPAVTAAGLDLPPENILGEPLKRNTAGCLVYVAAHVRARFGKDATMAVLTADHLIEPESQFREDVRQILQAVESEPSLGVLGIQPSRAETGYGYIEATCSPAPGDRSILTVAGFREKPEAAVAVEYYHSGRHFWNSGMFFWRLGTFRQELAHASPVHAGILHRMEQALAEGDQQEVEQAFADLPDISIDYALMERARRIVMRPAAFHWDDVGSWDALDRTHPRDEAGNVVDGSAVLLDCRNCIIVNDPGAQRMAVAVVGMEETAVVVAEDAVLVLPKDRAQDVKLAVAALKQRGDNHL